MTTADSHGTPMPHDSVGAFCKENTIALEPTGPGVLDSCTFATKDVMDVAGSTTGFGQPTWLATHVPSTENAPVVSRLLNAGARMIGKTVTDELTYSLSGENVHYGTPLNTAAPSRIPGGSSCGSVAAVAGSLVDFALGTDCAGSVRLPASYCGIYGMRPTHDRVSTQGVIPFAPSFDTVGWFARDAGLLQKVGSVLLGEHYQTSQPARLLIADDCFDLVESAIASALQPSVQQLQSKFSECKSITIGLHGLETWMECFRVIQGAEIWRNLGPWIEKHQPALGPGIDDRIEAASKITQAESTSAQADRVALVDHLQQQIRPGDVLCLPSSPRVAPAKGTPSSTVEVTYRYQAICLLSIAGLGGLPEISLPMAELDGYPLGLSIVGAKGTDRQLLELAAQL